MKTKITKIAMIVFIVMSFVQTMSTCLFTAILDKIALEMHISVAQAGFLSSSYAYGAGFGVPVVLILFRKTKRTTLIKYMLALFVLSTVFLLVTSDFSILLVVRFLAGLSGNTYYVLSIAYIAVSSEKNRVGRNLSTMMTGNAFALMIGLPLTRSLDYVLTWRSEFIILLILMVASLIYFIFRMTDDNSNVKPLILKTELKSIVNRDVLAHILSSFIICIGYGAFYMYIIPYFIEMFPVIVSSTSFILFLIGSFCLSGNLVGGYFYDRRGFIKPITHVTFFQVIICVLILLSNKSLFVNVFLILIWFANGWFLAVQINSGITIVTKNKSDLVVAFNTSASLLGQAVGASFAAAVINIAGISNVVLIPLIAALFVLIVRNIYYGKNDYIRM